MLKLKTIMKFRKMHNFSLLLLSFFPNVPSVILQAFFFFNLRVRDLNCTYDFVVESDIDLSLGYDCNHYCKQILIISFCFRAFRSVMQLWQSTCFLKNGRNELIINVASPCSDENYK